MHFLATIGCERFWLLTVWEGEAKTSAAAPCLWPVLIGDRGEKKANTDTAQAIYPLIRVIDRCQSALQMTFWKTEQETVEKEWTCSGPNRVEPNYLLCI